MKTKWVLSFLIMATMICPVVAFAAQEEPVAVEETIAVAEDAAGDVVGEVDEDVLYAPETVNDIKTEAKEAVKEIRAEEKEALKEAKK